MFKKILVPLDGSELAEIALPYVRELSVRLGSEIALLHACAPNEVHYCHVNQVYLEQTANSLRDQLAKAHGKQGQITSAVVSGNTVDEILKFADDNNISMIAMSTHGRAGIGRWVLGSVADKLVRSSAFPILLVRSKVAERVPAERWPAKGILVPLDGSETGEAALPYVEQLAATLSKPVILQQVIATEYRFVADMDGGGLVLTDKAVQTWKANAQTYLENVSARLKKKGVESRIETNTGAPAEKIIECAKKCGVDLIAMSTHGFSGIARFVLGSVADRVLQASDTPLLLVGPKEAKTVAAKVASKAAAKK